MSKQKITYFLGFLFLIIGFSQVPSLLHILKIKAIPTIPTGNTEQINIDGFLFLNLLLRFVQILRIILLMFTFFACAGLLRCSKWARKFSLILLSILLVGTVNLGLLYGSSTFLTWHVLLKVLVYLAVFVFLITSEKVKEIYGFSQKKEREIWINCAIWWMIPLALMFSIVFIKVKYKQPKLTTNKEIVHIANEVLDSKDKKFITIHKAKIISPNNVFISKIRIDKSLTVESITVKNNEKTFYAIINFEGLGKLVKKNGVFAGIKNPYDIHKNIINAKFNFVFLTLAAMVIPYRGEGATITQVETPKWRGILHEGGNNKYLVREYSIYMKNGKSDESLSVILGVNKEIPGFNSYENIAMLDFASGEKKDQEFLTVAHEMKKANRLNESQIAYLNAYLNSKNDLSILKELILISKELGAREAVKDLCEHFLKYNLNDIEINNLYAEEMNNMQAQR